MGGNKYTRAERRLVWRINTIRGKVRKHQIDCHKRGVLPNLELKAECGALMSYLLVKMNGKYTTDARV